MVGLMDSIAISSTLPASGVNLYASLPGAFNLRPMCALVGVDYLNELQNDTIVSATYDPYSRTNEAREILGRTG
jgi:hypothetical protein